MWVYHIWIFSLYSRSWYLHFSLFYSYMELHQEIYELKRTNFWLFLWHKFNKQFKYLQCTNYYSWWKKSMPGWFCLWPYFLCEKATCTIIIFPSGYQLKTANNGHKVCMNWIFSSPDIILIDPFLFIIIC